MKAPCINVCVSNKDDQRYSVICNLKNILFAHLVYVHTGTISYRYRTGLIFGTEKLTVHTGPICYRTVP